MGAVGLVAGMGVALRPERVPEVLIEFATLCGLVVI